MLSGFLITGLLDREKVQTGSIGLLKFYFRRVLRLFPALFVFLAVVCVLIKLRVITDTPWYAVLACLIYVRNIWGRGYATNHIWSLSVEEQFYASWPWIMKVVGRTNALRIAVVRDDCRQLVSHGGDPWKLVLLLGGHLSTSVHGSASTRY